MEGEGKTGLLGIIGGTSLLKCTRFQNKLEERTETTPYGSVLLHFGPGYVFVQRHKSNPEKPYSPPHLINAKAILAGLQKVGVTRIVCFASVGSLKEDIPVSTMVICDDFFNFFTAPTQQTFYDDARGHIVPKVTPEWRAEIIALLQKNQDSIPNLKLKHDKGTYVQTVGPRFETAAEVRVLATYGDVVGMTSATEIVLACELKIPVALVSMIDNYANGIGKDQLTVEGFHEAVARNEKTVEAVLNLILDNFAPQKQ
eukprot:TRINITY_DN22833_c0_g1_i1.p1 TRINITY_DN22833_c0_g1~~TRINITY_DN22833_c0_g1_i1.p1  ORF type:complete len:268 (-),score=62.56 TRINITY_DN22833_c0_g1_i1:11-781(-)